MSWMADLYICEPSPRSDDLYVGELRPWPDAVRVWRGNTDEPWPDAVRARRGDTDEMRRYVPERTYHEIWDEDTGCIICSECGAVHDEDYTSYYCWCCGARVEVDE